MDTKPFIEFKNVSKSYGSRKILSNFNTEVSKGEFVTVIGSSGCGKTTMLKMINGLITAESGTVSIDGNDIAKMDQIQLRRKIGYVIQSTGLFPHMTVRENILYVPKLIKMSRPQMKKRLNAMLDIIDLDKDMLKRYPAQLSGGQQQRVGIARALAAEPLLLLMDEPFGAADEITRRSLQEEISKIHSKMNITAVFVTHDIKEALTLGTKVMIINAGNIEQFDTPQNIVSTPRSAFVKELVGEHTIN